MLFRFRKFPVYLKAKEFRNVSKNLLIKFPKSEDFNLKLQIRRALDSICLNIAEGSNRLSDKDKAHFLNQALTSLEEVISGFDLSLDDKYITDKDMNKLLEISENLEKQLISFSKYLTIS